MTFSALRQLHAIIGDALEEMEQVYAEASASGEILNSSTPGSPRAADVSSSSSPCTKESPGASLFKSGCYASPPPSPSISTYSQTSPLSTPSTPPSTPIDFPSLDSPWDPNSQSEMLTTHPDVVFAINKIIGACGQISATVQQPFLYLSDAVMSYHLPACMRLFEASHTPEILQKAGPDGLHVAKISEENGVEESKLAHILRLLSTHHYVREVSPDVFANNRISSIMSTGKPVEDLKKLYAKYRNTNGVAAYVGMCTDELQKSAAYLTEAYLLSPYSHKNTKDPTRAPFNYAFGCEGIGFFGWLEGEGIDGNRVNGADRPGHLPGLKVNLDKIIGGHGHQRTGSNQRNPTGKVSATPPMDPLANPNRFRLERFGIAMTGTESWEIPGNVLQGFDWQSLPKGSVIVDVGGGIGSTSMLLAHAFSRPGDEDALGLKFVVQDREVVVAMGEKAWQAKCSEYLEQGIAEFQVHDFFTPQPIKDAAVFILRVVLHDWPADYARMILLRLREAATNDTKLLIADFVLPMACDSTEGLEGIEGAITRLAPTPLLANLGKASANVYWMDMTMQVTFNGQERTLREIVSLAHSAGWKVTKIVKGLGSHFGHITAIPDNIPVQRRVRAGSGSAFFDAAQASRTGGGTNADILNIPAEIYERSHSRCGTPTFGSRMALPSFEEARSRFGKALRGTGKRLLPLSGQKPGVPKPTPNVQITASTRKAKPSPLSIPPGTPSPAPSRPALSPKQPSQSQMAIKRQTSHAQLSQAFQSQSQLGSTSPTPSFSRIPPPSPLSPRRPTLPLSRRSSFANMSSVATGGTPNPPSMIPIRQGYEPSSASPSPLPPLSSSLSPLSPPSPIAVRQITRRKSHAQLSPGMPRKRSESIITPSALLCGRTGGNLNSLMRTLELSEPNDSKLHARRALDFSERGMVFSEIPYKEEEEEETTIPDGSLLAAAAQIGRGLCRRDPS
ncbi:ich1 protein [Moniliophthora roreri MCA 2997]|uniref:Ich1 protein n=1 Tax=Moniliophthora roreri (strain MCA 2997) TaxID=1381753 RepID=V2XGG2_MONRO|nr:ich1 protein [Moniliophthora roreri MCA 2997]